MASLFQSHPVLCLCTKCQVDDEWPAAQTRSALCGSLTWRAWYHSLLLRPFTVSCASLPLCICLCLVLNSEVIGSLVAVCLCVGSFSYLKCFIVPVWQEANSCRSLRTLNSFSADHRGFLAVAVSLFWCCLMVEILTS